MNDEFLHRLRVQPRPEFLLRLKSKLDRQPLQPRARLIRSLAAGLLVGVSALALASLALQGGFAWLHWNGWSGARESGGAGMRAAANPASGQGLQSLSDRGLHNPWEVARQRIPGNRRGTEASATGAAAVVPIPQSGTAAANLARASSATGLLRGPAAEPLWIGTSPAAESFVRVIAQDFGRAAKLAQPHIQAEPTDRLLASLCGETNLNLAIVPRRMTATEAARCVRRSAMTGTAIVEMKLGHQAIMFVRSKLYGPLQLSARDLYLALSKTVPDVSNPGARVPNRYQSWNEVDPALPPDRILVFGPALASELGETLRAVLESGCKTVLAQAASPGTASPIARSAGVEDDAAEACTSVREDGAYVDVSSEAPALLAQNLEMLPTAIAVLGFTPLLFAGENLVPSPIDGVQPSEQTIASGSYPAARTFYLYLNKDHARSEEGVHSFVRFCLSVVDGEYSPAGRRYLIPPSPAEGAEIRANASAALGYPATGERR